MPYSIGLDGAEVTALGAGFVHLGLKGNDTANGAGGEDTSFGGRGNDELDGADGRDFLAGGQGRDLVMGGLGDDIISGGGFFSSFGVVSDDRNRDTLQGGDGNDAVIAGLNDIAEGGLGFDSLLVNWNNVPTAAIVLDFSGIGGAAPFATGVGSLSAIGFERLELSVFQLFAGSTVTATAGDDVIDISVDRSTFGIGPAGGISINGGGGDDWIEVYDGGSDIIVGGAGDDILSGNEGRDTLNGGAGSDLFFTSLQIVVPNAPNPNADVIAGFNAAADLLVLSVDRFSALPLAYNANLLISGSAPLAQAAGLAQFLYNTTNGQLFFDANGSTAGEVYRVATLTGAPSIGADNLVVDSQFSLVPLSESALGSSFGLPALTPSVGVVYQQAGTGGDDVLGFGAAENRLFGNAGDDTITGGAGSDLLSGNVGDDEIRGAGGNDQLNGGAGGDRLSGDNGDDSLFALDAGVFSPSETDIDTLSGGNGNDTVSIGRNDIASGGTGTDTLVIFDFGSGTGAPVPLTIDFGRIQGATNQTFGYFVTKASGFEAVNFTAELAAASIVTGTSGNDTITVFGTGIGTGFTVNGGNGNDTIESGGSADTINGGAGEDIITITEADTVTGGAGSDTFLFIGSQATGATASITDFGATDVLLFLADLPFSIGGVLVNIAPTMNTTARLVSGATPVATDPGLAQFLYNTTTKVLSIDVNGSTAGGIIGLATFTGASLAPTAGQLAVEIGFDIF